MLGADPHFEVASYNVVIYIIVSVAGPTLSDGNRTIVFSRGLHTVFTGLFRVPQDCTRTEQTFQLAAANLVVLVVFTSYGVRRTGRQRETG